MFSRAVSEFNKGCFEEALRCLEAAENFDKVVAGRMDNHPAFLYYKYETLMALSRHDEAAICINELRESLHEMAARSFHPQHGDTGESD